MPVQGFFHVNGKII